MEIVGELILGAIGVALLPVPYLAVGLIVYWVGNGLSWLLYDRKGGSDG